MAALERLRRRADFLRTAKGKRVFAHGFTLQMAPRQESEPAASSKALGGAPEPRLGFTVTKQLGGAVARNRIRRRFKEALRLTNPLPARPGFDYVVVARPGALEMEFHALQMELKRVFNKAFSLPSQARPGQQAAAASRPGKAAREISTGRTPLGRTPKG